MKKLLYGLLILFFTLTCKEKSDVKEKTQEKKEIDSSLIKILEDYQKNNTPKNVKGTFIYSIHFYLSKHKDTTIVINLSPTGVNSSYSKYRNYGVYELNNLPFYIIDEDSLSKNYIKRYKNSNWKKYKVPQTNFNDVIYPYYFYTIKNEEIIFSGKQKGNFDE